MSAWPVLNHLLEPSIPNESGYLCIRFSTLEQVEKAVTSGYRFVRTMPSPSTFGEKLGLVGLLTTRPASCRQRISPPSQHKPVTRCFHGKRIRSVLTATYPSAPSGAGPCSGISPIPLFSEQIRVPPDRRGRVNAKQKPEFDIQLCSSYTARPGKSIPSSRLRPAGGVPPHSYYQQGRQRLQPRPGHGWWGLRH